ncbi:retrovirus-related pol polyprotein from transposon TNT 1-94 [Tanacetum coccineum]
MDSEKYLEGQSMQRLPLFESDSFIYWKNRFETYVKSKDLDLWHVITNGDFQPIEQNPETKLDEGSTSQIESKVTTIEESKDLTSLSLDELIRNLKVHEMIIKKDSEIVKAKRERKSLALKAKKKSSDEECSTSGSEDEKYAMAVRDFKKFFKRRECPKPPKDKNQRAFIGGSWSDSGEEDDEKAKDETCLVAQASNEICLGVDLEPDEWIKDIVCSKHMTGQICDNKCIVTFSTHDSEITKDGKVIGRGIRKKGLYVMKLGNKPKDKIFLATIDENSALWHKRLGHANMRLIHSLAFKELVRNLPKLKFDQHFYDACKIRKQAHASHKAKNIVLTTRCLELLHMDLFGPSAVQSYGGNLYTLVIVDDNSRKPTLDHFMVFGSKCFILNTKDYLTKFDPKSYEYVFLGHSQNSKAYIILNKHTIKIEESLNVTFDESPPPSKTSTLVDDDLDEVEANEEPKNVNEALTDESWIIAMQEELNQFIANDVWELVPQPKNMAIIGTKWVFRISRLESIRILLAYAYSLDFKLFQMDVKSAFLNSLINEEVYVAQPPRFTNFDKPNHVYKLKKTLYSLKQEPKAWYDRLKAFLIKHEYKIGMVDNTLFTKKKSSNLFIVQTYVDDIIFDLFYQDMCIEFAKIMHDEFEMSMMGELNFFFGLQIKQMEDGIFFNQSKYIKEMLKKIGLEDCKPMKTPMSSNTKLTKDEVCESVDSTKYRGVICSLLYLTASRLDIMFIVCLCARFQEAPKTFHLEAFKHIFDTFKALRT